MISSFTMGDWKRGREYMEVKLKWIIEILVPYFFENQPSYIELRTIH